MKTYRFKNINFLKVAALLLLFIISSCISCQKEKEGKPNIIFIVADDLGYGDLQCYGNPILETPNIDHLAQKGVLFTHYYSPSPLCAPARAAILTGRYNHRTGAVDVSSNRAVDRIALSEKTIADYFKKEGYATALVGKWHNGLYDLQYHPNNRGFDYFLGSLSGIQDYYDWVLYRNGATVLSNGEYLTDVLNEDAIHFIEKNKSKPFFLLLAHLAPHVPLMAPDSLIAKYMNIGGGKINKKVATLYAMVESIDTGLGNVFDTLDSLGLANNTIVVFTSDNGGLMSSGMKRFEGGLSGNKGIVLEEGIRVPAIISYPGVIAQNKRISVPIHGCDWLPTLMSLANLDLNPIKKVDGVDISPLLKGVNMPELKGRQLFFQKNRYYPAQYSDAAVIEGTWKLYWPGIPETMKKKAKDSEIAWYGANHPHWEMPCDTVSPKWNGLLPSNPMLFNLEKDPSEKTDISAEYPGKVKEMVNQWDFWFSDVMEDYESSWEEIKQTEKIRWNKKSLKIKDMR